MTDNYTWSSDGPTCPYCGYEITPDDGFYYNEMRYISETCPECEKEYDVEVYTETSWRCSKKEEIASLSDPGTEPTSNSAKAGSTPVGGSKDDKK